MAQGNFPAALQRVLVYEGGKVDSRHDPGGRTAYGVTQRVYTAFRRRQGLAPRDVYQIERAELVAIYLRQYGEKVRFDDLPLGVDLVVFDGAVNSGPVQSAKWLQRALGTVRVDGIIGDATLQAVREHPDHDRLIADILDRRMTFLRALRTWRHFGKGWTSRLANLRKAGQAQASGTVGPKPRHVPGGAAKANIEDAKRVPGKEVAEAAASGGLASTTLQPIVEALTPLAEMLPSVRTVLTTLTVLGMLAAVAGVAYRLWATRQEAHLADALDQAPAIPASVDEEIDPLADLADNEGAVASPRPL